MRLEICDEPVFVVGAPRSGTSMMHWSLLQHPALWGGEESDWLGPLVRHLHEDFAFGSTRGRLHWLSNQGVTWPEFLRHVGYGVNALYVSRSGGRRWVEQTPRYTLHLDDLAAMFPGARFLLMLRDGRDVVASLRNFVRPQEHDEACRTWRRFTEAGLAGLAHEVHGPRVRGVRYETVVANTGPTVDGLLEWLGLPPEPRSVEFITRGGRINSSFEADGPPRAPRWHAWTAAERETFRDIAGDLLVELGYEPDDSWIHHDATTAPT